MVFYRVYIGQLELTLMVLNLPRRGMSSGRRLMYKSPRSEVFEVDSMHGKPYVCKRTYFRYDTKIFRYAEDRMSWNIQSNAD